VPRDRWTEVTRVGPLLLGGLVACSAAAGGLSNSLDEPAFEALLHALIVVGFVTSLLGTVLRVNVSLIGVAVIAVALAACVQRGAPVPILSAAFPPEVIADEDLTWATLWAWMMVGFCFMQVKRRNILFCIVAGLAVLGLTSTVNLNTVMMVYFGVFLFAAIFVWGYEHLLNLGEEAMPVQRISSRPPGLGARRAWPAIAQTQALAGTMLVALVMVLALGVGGLLYATVPRMYLSPSRMSRYARWMRVSILIHGGMINTFYVGRGPANLSSAPVIKVKADKPALWRGQAYDRYTGSGWTKEASTITRLVAREDGWMEVPGADQIEGEINRQVVSLVGMESRAIFAAARPVKVRINRQQVGAGALNYYAETDAYDCMATRFLMNPGVEYEVISKMPPSDPERLRDCPAEYSQEMIERYMARVPAQAQAELGGLVKELTSEAETPYDKVIALREYLAEQCVYSERAPTIPRGQDAAAYFVNRGRKGACGLFATALAVMCRLAGVPARVATGFQTGSYDAEAGAFTALHRDAHAWTEVYFPGVGWVPFDQAARRSEDGPGWLTAFANQDFVRKLGEVLEQAWRVLLGVLAFAALFSALLGPGALLSWVRRRLRPRDTRERIGEAYERFRWRAARLAGLKPQRWQTPEEMTEALVASGAAGGGQAREEVAHFTEAFYACRYGRREPSERHVRHIKTLAARALEAIRRERRGALRAQ